MKIQYFNGGLGNQIFQYIFYRFVQLHGADDIWLDDMKFYKVKEHNGYELEKVFGVTPNLISNFFEKDVWEYMVQKSLSGEGDLCQQLKDAGEDIYMVAENERYRFDGKVNRIPANDYFPEIVQLPGNVYYFGYWIAKGWFEQIRPTIMQELKFPEIIDNRNLKYFNTIQNEKTVAVHIRRGDFLNLGWELSERFYYDSMEMITKHMQEATFLIFSDDIPWCKENYKELGFSFAGDRIQFVTGNEYEHSYIDMQLMSMCDSMILANSAFSYFAALYNNKEDKVILNPLAFRKV